MQTIIEPQRKIPVIAEADVCVLGGSCTGVFAAVRAARLGMRVVLIERLNRLGGVATAGLVNIWHTLQDMDDREQIIAGLTDEVITVLNARGALTVKNNRSSTYNFNPMELTIILDEMIREHGIRLMLHTHYSAVVEENGRLDAVIVENQDGRGAVRAKFFIDATGDGYVCRDLGIQQYVSDYIQPPTACFNLQGNIAGSDLKGIWKEHGAEFGLTDDWGWSARVAGLSGITMRADMHIFDVRCDRAEDLTRAEMEGRRQARAMLSLLQKYGDPEENYAITNLCSSLGVRETVHYRTRMQAKEIALLTGERYDAPIMNGTYPIDIHHHNDGGITFKYLDGKRRTKWGKGTRTEIGNWREEMGLTGEPAKYYQVPFDMLVGEKYENFIAAGRMINADEGAYGALRVMVNLNQLGEAAGVAAALCCESGTSLQSLDGRLVSETLRKGGSAV